MRSFVMPSAIDLTDPRCFPTDFDPVREEFLMFPLNLEQIGEAAFLDKRMGVAWTGAQRIPAAAVEPPTPAIAPAFIFHTAFCGSTLLARALHAPPLSVALKEPLVLMQLAAALRAAQTPEQAAGTRRCVAIALGLLGRPWVAGGRVLIKPTNVVDSLIPQLLEAAPRLRAVMLYSSLREFMISCCKKLPHAETRIRWMAQSLIHGTRLQRKLGVPSDHPFNFVEACVLTWYAQIERFAQALAADGHDDLRTLDMRVLFAAPAVVVRACAQWLRLEGALEGLDARVEREFSRNAKATTERFDPEQRESEKKLVLARFEPLVAEALQWAASAVEPHALMPQDWKPLEIG